MMKVWLCGVLTILSAIEVNSIEELLVRNSFNQEIYDLDSSWAIRSTNLQPTLGDKQELYNHFMKGCRQAAEDRAYTICDSGDKYRMKMNTFQPSSMRNYTHTGFKKIRAPDRLYSLVRDFWERNRHSAKIEWSTLNTYHNMWEAPPTLVNIQDSHIPGGGSEVQAEVWETSRRVLEDWTGMHLAPCSMWGIRIYHNNSILTPHVDRNPLVSSAIINVDQDVDEPWPLEVWGHDGMPYNVTMQPGDMILYESHSVVHGRPFPFRGRYFANIFLHFEPLGALRKEPGDTSIHYDYDADAMESIEQGLPPYILPQSPWEKEWRKNNPDGWKLLFSNKGMAVQTGDYRTLLNLYIQNPDKFHEPDENGWYPIHEAARAGDVEMTKWLLERGANPNEVTGFGNGQNALQLAKARHGEDHATIKLLEEYMDEDEL